MTEHLAIQEAVQTGPCHRKCSGGAELGCWSALSYALPSLPAPENPVAAPIATGRPVWGVQGTVGAQVESQPPSIQGCSLQGSSGLDPGLTLHAFLLFPLSWCSLPQ